MSGGEALRIGVIGAGGIANGVHLPSLDEIEGVQIAAVCDLIEDRATKAAEKYHIPATYILYPEMFEREQLDAVYVLTEPDRLFRPTLMALRAGLHVFMEKPPGLTTFETETLLREARSADRICQVGFNRRYIPVVSRVLEIMRDHTPITQVEGRFNKHTSAAFCGGAISSFPSDTIHAIDLVRWIAGGQAEAAATVTGQTDDVVTNRWNSVIRFDNGVTGIVKANYRTGGRVHTLEIHGPEGSAFVDLGFGGASCSAQLLLFGGKESYSLASTGKGDDRRLSLDGREVAGRDDFRGFYGYLDEDREFVDAIRSGRRPLTDIAEGVETMKLVDLLLASTI